MFDIYICLIYVFPYTFTYITGLKRQVIDVLCSLCLVLSQIQSSHGCCILSTRTQLRRYLLGEAFPLHPSKGVSGPLPLCALWYHSDLFSS